MNDYLSPDEISGASFETKRRGGLDPDSVRSHLRAAAKTVSALLDERDALLADLEGAQASVADTPATVAEPVELDEEALTEQLGQHAARVLAEARAAAADRIAEAEVEADEIRAAAEELHAQRSIDADAAAQRIRDDAERIRTTTEIEAAEAAAAIVANAERDATDMRTESSNSQVEAGEDASRIIREAEMTRRQILEDLARRRTAARRQIEQLRAGRERLLASHETVRRALDEISQELTISMSEARAAAETAGHTVSDTTIEELEAEIETARLSGLLDTGPLPVVSPATPTNKAATSKAIPTSTPPRNADVGSSKGPRSVEPVADLDADAGDVDGETVEDVDSSDVTDVSEAPSENSEKSAAVTGLAPVVSLEQARSDVETKGHPAAGRAASSGRAKDAGEDETSAKSGESRTPTPIVSVVSTDEDEDVDVAALDKEELDAEEIVDADESGSEEVAESEEEELVDSDDVDDAAETDDVGGSAETDDVDGSAEIDASGDEDPAEIEVTEEEAAKAAELDEEFGTGDSVDDLFASLRGSSESAAPEVEETAVEETAIEEVAVEETAIEEVAVEETAVEEVAAVEEPADAVGIDRSEIARRMKRVLADEQSRVMSTLKGREDVPSLEEILDSVDAHIESYWNAIESQLAGLGDGIEPIQGFVDQIRRKVSDALSAEDDTNAIVDSMRSMYREFKTSGVEACVSRIENDVAPATG